MRAIRQQVITDLNQVTPEWLTAVLRDSGALTSGAVAAFDAVAGEGNWSSSGTLRLRYSEDAGGERPSRLFLKMVDTDAGDGEFFGPSEVTYYTRDYVDVDHAPLLRCYDGQYSEALQRYHLLLQDVSQTHVKAGEKEPTPAYGLALAEALATLHARWWGAQRLEEAKSPVHDPAHIRRFVAIAEPGVANIVEQLSHELEPHWPAALRDLFANLPGAMIQRTADKDSFTLIHGDVGPGNVLVPQEGQNPLYIIDRQPFNWSLTTWLGVYDLAYAIVLEWEPQLRRKHETSILQKYHESLLRNGVEDYSWQRLWDDYRLCTAAGVTIAVEYCRGGINKRWQSYWLPMLQRALTACDDLGCSGLWQ